LIAVSATARHGSQMMSQGREKAKEPLAVITFAQLFDIA
jgi:hypothetical protein